jgi:regulator of RNase E activity RraA
MSRLSSEIKRLNSSDASDALLSLGMTGVLKDVHSFAGSDKLMGFAKTVRVAPMKNKNLTMKEGFLNGSLHTGQDTVLVIVIENDNYSAFGGLTSFIVKNFGKVGVVICGFFRDVQEVNEHGLSVFAKGVSPLIPKEGQSVSSIGKPVEYQGVKINTGDLVIGDKDGITIVPLHLLDEVLKATKQKRENEKISKARLKEYFRSEIRKSWNERNICIQWRDELHLVCN